MEHQRYSISTILDILNLTEEQRIRMVPDLLVWASYYTELSSLNDEVFKVEFIWIDDGDPGVISGVRIEEADDYFDDILDTPEQLELLQKRRQEIKEKYPNLVELTDEEIEKLQK